MDESIQIRPISAYPTNLYVAYCKARLKFRKPQLNREAEVKNQGKHLYTNYYADLEECIDCIDKPLIENGLVWFQFTEKIDKEWYLVLELIHSASGESKKTMIPVNVNQPNQQLGGTLTYLKRYQLSAFFGLAADYDADGNQNSENEIKIDEIPKHRQSAKKEWPQRYLEAMANEPNPPPPAVKPKVDFPPPNMAPKAHPKEIMMNLVRKKEISFEEMPLVIEEALGYKKPGKELSTAEMESVIEYLSQSPSSGVAPTVANGRGEVVTDNPAPDFFHQEFDFDQRSH